MTINEVEAELVNKENLDLKKTIERLIGNFKPIAKLLDETTFKSGTIIRINYLADFWDEYTVKKIFENLEILVPPKELPIFKVHLFSSLQETEYGEVASEICDDFDYKVTANYLNNNDKTVLITIKRNELDINLIERSYMEVFNLNSMKTFPYDFKTLKGKEYRKEITLFELIPGFKDVDKNNVLNQIGEFSFTFYFLKNAISADENKTYPYKSISSVSRKAWLNKFSGVKIFRDSFRIRPYGESKNDWLNLGDRQASSPGGAGQKLGGYRIRPNQISGSINISRITNESFQDKSGREGIQENDAFNLFKEIIIGIIEIFEKDRNAIMSSFNELNLRRNENEKTKEKAKEVVAKIKKRKNIAPAQKRLLDGEPKSNDSDDKDTDLLTKGFIVQEQELKEKKDELRLARSLASSGLIVATFAHELKQIRNHMEHRTTFLKDALLELLDPVNIKSLDDTKNPFIMVDIIKSQDSKLIKWINFSLLALKKSKRERTNINMVDYFELLKETWSDFLSDSSINLNINSENKSCIFRGFYIDLDSIFANLITNSIEAFKEDGSSKNRIIDINWKTLEERLTISYKDSGCGLSDDYKKDPYVIFNAFETTKRDKYGNKTGTGLGLWLVKNIVDDYSGRINILKPDVGFQIEIIFPLTKQIGDIT